jgi:hypothetical protein
MNRLDEIAWLVFLIEMAVAVVAMLLVSDLAF